VPDTNTPAACPLAVRRVVRLSYKTASGGDAM
jgi:hypothetical protein